MTDSAQFRQGKHVQEDAEFPDEDPERMDYNATQEEFDKMWEEADQINPGVDDA